MLLRDARPTDCGHLVMLLQRAYEETTWDAPEVDVDKARFIFQETAKQVGNPRVFMKVCQADDHIAAVAMAERAPSMWHHGEMVFGHHLYAEPAARGSFMVGRMLAELERWAFSEPAVIRFENTSGINPYVADDLFLRIGLQPIGNVYAARNI